MDFVKRILDPDIKLRRRMIQLLSTIALAEFVIVTIYTIANGSDFAHIALMVAGTAAFAITMAFTFKTDHIREGAAVSGLLYFLLYPLTFFQSGGMYGGAPVTFTFALVYVFLVTQKWERGALMSLCILITGGCYVLANFHPEMLDRHTVLAEHVESFLAIMLVVLLICMLFKFVTDVYITENRIVQRQKKEIEDLNNAQKRFFSTMSHEIRTPVNAVIGLNEINMRENIPDEVLENSKNIEVAGKILLQTVNEIMDMSRLETGTMEILPAEYQTTAMMSDIVGMTWLRAKEKGLEFSIDVDPGVPSKLYGDEVRIKQILINIVTNAVKYTPEGSVALAIKTRPAQSVEPAGGDASGRTAGSGLLGGAGDSGRTAGSGPLGGAGDSGRTAGSGPLDGAGDSGRTAGSGPLGGVEMCIMEYDVKDTGIGIKEENIPYLFSSFQRVDDQKTHAIEGTGLGLSIVKQLLDLMDGTVTVTSEYGKGSCFHVEIPQKIVDASPVGEVDVTSRDGLGKSWDAASEDRGRRPDESQSSYQSHSGRATSAKAAVAAVQKDAGRNSGQQDHFTSPDTRILAVDDTPMNLMVIKKLLRATQVQLDTAQSGKEALDFTAENHYDIILMDHQMPEMDGVECLKKIRSQEGGKSRDAKAVCLTANAGADMKKRYMEAGFDGYLEKPVRGATLEETLKDMLAR